MVIFIDPQIAGISGDMLISALVDLGADKSKIIEGIKTAEKNLEGSSITQIDFQKIKKNNTDSTQLVLDIKENFHERKGIEILDCITKSASEINISQKAKDFATSSIRSLLEAESKIHGESIDSVHFHEAASIDTVIDIIGTAIASDDLNLFDDEIITAPVAVGGGILTFSHGTTSNPASAILEIFKNSGISISGGLVKDELTTPTGACILTSLTKRSQDFYPSMKIKSIGYGAGKKDFEGFSNVLKLVLGEKSKDLIHDSVKVLETNVDDVSGEVIGNLIEKIMASGAKDITIASALTKKGRPTNLISIICDNDSVNPIVDVLIYETGTLGIRIHSSDRITIPRKIATTSVHLYGTDYTIHYKTAEHQNFKNFKVEYEDIKAIAESLKKSFKETEELIKTKIKKKLES